jgi:hypothetical protein
MLACKTGRLCLLCWVDILAGYACCTFFATWLCSLSMLTILAMLFGYAIYAGRLCWLRNLAMLVTLSGYACNADIQPVYSGWLCLLCCL